MNADRYRQIGDLYHEALELPVAERAIFLERACNGDADLRDEVESLLAAHEHADAFIEPAPENRAVFDLVLSSAATLGEPPPDFNASESGGTVLEPGHRLGRYEIRELLGAGGMGAVYRALDPTLDREVAIKALAPTFRDDALSLRRFEREAQLLAAVSHPNIATIYGFERLDGAPYLLLECVHGETLANRLARGALSIDDAVRVALQIVSGLEEAHAKNIVHRDLKPSNVMLAGNGVVKLVDFGLAKTALPRSSPRPSDAITQAGIVLGTARYMSPEQIRGEPVDARTDVWAFGCVLYEMLTARPAFAGRSVSELVAAVLRDDPHWRLLPDATPESIRRVLRRCLRREHASRLRHIGDARLELEERDDEHDGDGGDKSEYAARAPRRAATRGALVGIAIGAVAVLAAVNLLRRPGPATEPSAIRLSVELPTSLAASNSFWPPFAIGPSGSPLIFEATEGGRPQLYSRDLTDATVRSILGTEDARQPFLSVDGAWIGFFANRRLAKVPVGGGPVQALADIGGNPRGASWAPDGSIVVSPTQTSGLVRVPDGGGRPIQLTTLDQTRGEASHRWPDVLPGGKWVLFTVGIEDAPYDEGRIDAVSMESGERRTVLEGAGFARYQAPGRLLFVRGGLLHAVDFDPDRVSVLGTSETVVDGVRYDRRNGGAHVATAASGALMFTPGQSSTSDFYLAWVDENAQFTRVTDSPRPVRDIRVSPEGGRIAAVLGTAADSDLWIVDAKGTLSRLTFSLSPFRPTWTPGGNAITVGAQRSGKWQLVTVAADGNSEPTVLFESEYRLYPNAWSPDGRYLVFQESRPQTGWDLQLLEFDAEGRRVGAPRAFANTPFHESSAALSRDGRWIAYESDELDAVVQIYARSFPDGAHKVQVSPQGGRWPAWDTQHRVHFWQTGESTLLVVNTQDEANELSLGTPQALWDADSVRGVLNRIAIAVAGARFDVEGRGRRLLVLERSPTNTQASLAHPMMVLGWPAPAGKPSR